MSYIHLIYPPKKMDNECQFVSHPFKSRKYVQKDEFGNCVLGLPKPVPLEIVNAGEGCGAHPSLSVKVVAMKEGEEGYDSSNLQVYFSEDHGDTYYNEGNAHVATPHSDRMLLGKKGNDEEDQSVSSSAKLEDRELLAFHAETQRKLCETFDPNQHHCWNVYKSNQWCYTEKGKRPQGPWDPYRILQDYWRCRTRLYCNDVNLENGGSAPKCTQTVEVTGYLGCVYN